MMDVHADTKPIDTVVGGAMGTCGSAPVAVVAGMRATSGGGGIAKAAELALGYIKVVLHSKARAQGRPSHSLWCASQKSASHKTPISRRMQRGMRMRHTRLTSQRKDMPTKLTYLYSHRRAVMYPKYAKPDHAPTTAAATIAIASL